MDSLSLQQYQRLQIEEKHRIDEYSVFLEDTVRNVRYLNLRGKSQLAYLQSECREHRKGVCRGVPEQKFLTAVLADMKK